MVYVRRVVGESMVPTLKPGMLIVAIRKTPHVGDIVIALVGEREVVKRVAKIDSSSAQLEGDNSKHSTDSRQYGDVPLKAIKGVVLFR